MRDTYGICPGPAELEAHAAIGLDSQIRRNGRTARGDVLAWPDDRTERE